MRIPKFSARLVPPIAPPSSLHSSVRKVAICSLLFLALDLLAAGALVAHGSIVVPMSRIAHCRFNDNPEAPSGAACAAAVSANGGPQFLYDWNGVRQGDAAGQHQLLVPDGEICSGGNSEFLGLDLVRDDWVATQLPSGGTFEFVYQATAPHATQDMLFYVTKQGWDPTTALTWADLDFIDDPLEPNVVDPFCHFDDATLEDDPSFPDQVYKMNCPMPTRTGRHVIFHIWQRSDSPEAFYACIDVVFTSNELFSDGFETGDLSAWN